MYIPYNISTILISNVPYIWPYEAIKFAKCASGRIRAVARNSRAKPGYLLFKSGLMFNTSWNVTPCSIGLTFGYIITSKCADHFVFQYGRLWYFQWVGLIFKYIKTMCFNEVIKDS